MNHLPAVGGRTIDGTLNWFEHRCRVYLDQEQRRINPDNGLIAVLCDAVRVKREYEDSRAKQPQPPAPTEAVARLAGELADKVLWSANVGNDRVYWQVLTGKARELKAALKSGGEGK